VVSLIRPDFGEAPLMVRKLLSLLISFLFIWVAAALQKLAHLQILG
jgi:hypothetical protein